MSAHFVMLRNFSRRDTYSQRSAYPGYIWAVDGCAASPAACRWLSPLLAPALSCAACGGSSTVLTGFGKRPALLVIDVNWAFCGERPEHILDSIKRWRTSCGEQAWVALKYIKTLIEAARAKGVPVIYTTGERRGDNWDAGSWRWKSTRGDEASGSAHDGLDGNEIVTMIAPGAKDIVIKKQKPSGFFGTNLASYLTLLGCDSAIVVGTTTSGCVRATVVDAFSLNYRVILPEEGCFDRSEASHAVSWCDMHAKYADVVPTAEILAYFDQLPAELFDLPAGVRTATQIKDAAE
jgi:maleamate amidohydrolase